MSKVSLKCRMSGVECRVNKVVLSLSSSSLRIWFKACGNNADAVQVGLERWGRSNPAHRGNSRMQLEVGWGGAGWLRTSLVVSVQWYKSCSLAPEILCLCVCLFVSIHFYSCALHNCTHFTAKYTQKTHITLIYVFKNFHFTTEVRFYGAYGLCGVCIASVINSGIKYAINKCSSKFFSIIYDYTTVHDLLCHGIRVVPTWA